MVNLRHMSLDELAKLFDPDFVATRKINTIKIVRQITDEGLKETKDWVEQFLQPTVTNMSHNKVTILNEMPEFDPDEILQQIESLRRDVADLKRANATEQAKGIF